MSETIAEVAAPEAGTTEDDLRAAANAEMDAGDTQQTETTSEASEPEAPEPEPEEEVELSFGAKTLKVAKSAIPEAVLAELDQFTKGVQGDYTQKTQALAEQRKAVEEQQQLFTALSALRGEALASYATGQSLAAEIRQLEGVDLNSLWQSNPDQARQISDTLQAKRGQFQQAVHAVAQHEQAMTAEEQRATAKLIDAGRAEMQRRVKGFDAKGEADLIQYAVSEYGIPEQEARKWPLNASTAAMAWKAMQFDRLQASTKAATAPKPPVAPAAPTRALKPGTGAQGPRDLGALAETDMEAFVRERERQDKARRGR